MTRVLITGAAGAIGSVVRKDLAACCEHLRLVDIKPIAHVLANEEAVTCDLANLSSTLTMFKDVDCIVHLAAIPTEDSWDAILQNNIVATYNVFEAARISGIKRVVYASSHHAVGFHRFPGMIDEHVNPRPDSRYGVGKVFAESLGRLYADKYGLSVACIRIGAFREAPENVRHLSTWIGHEDMAQLVRRCVGLRHFIS